MAAREKTKDFWTLFYLNFCLIMKQHVHKIEHWNITNFPDRNLKGENVC